MEQIKRAEETVVIYDDFGIPSIMRKIPKMTNAELFGGSDKINGAFIIGGEECDEIYLPVYDGTMIDGRMYSLPYARPATGITQEEFEAACFSKGEGWHPMTAIEWGLLANISLQDGTIPHGNTASGHYHADKSEKGRTYDGHRTLTGSGPRTWTHNHQPDGIHDLCGNIWKRLRGMRLMDGRIQIAKNNDAALPIDLSRIGDGWIDVVDAATGTPLFIRATSGIIIGTDKPTPDWNGSVWCGVDIQVEISEIMRELALFPGEPKTWVFADTEGERCAARGGPWSNGADYGVFYLSFVNDRSRAYTDLGGRPAYFKRKQKN